MRAADDGEVHGDTGSSRGLTVWCAACVSDVFLCSEVECGKFYHMACLGDQRDTRMLKDGKSFICPRHRCAACHRACKANSKHSGSYEMCLRCTNSYHTSRCMPSAGVYHFTAPGHA